MLLMMAVIKYMNILYIMICTWNNFDFDDSFTCLLPEAPGSYTWRSCPCHAISLSASVCGSGGGSASQPCTEQIREGGWWAGAVMARSTFQVVIRVVDGVQALDCVRGHTIPTLGPHPLHGLHSPGTAVEHPLHHQGHRLHPQQGHRPEAHPHTLFWLFHFIIVQLSSQLLSNTINNFLVAD